MTTIGYGDIMPSTTIAKLIANIYLPMGVLALADAVADVQVSSPLPLLSLPTAHGMSSSTLTSCNIRGMCARAQMIALRRSIRETDFGKLADECLLRDAVRGDEPKVDSVLTEAEFLVDQLTNCARARRHAP